MTTGDFFFVVGIIFLLISTLSFLRELYIWAFQHGYAGIAVASFVVGVGCLILGGIIEQEPQSYETRPRAINRK